MNENEFEYCGKRYVAISGLNCGDCAMWDADECMCNAVSSRDFIFPSCNNSQRKDGRDVIFMEVQDERAKG